MDINSNTPLYVQLEQLILSEIRSGIRKDGDRIESIRELTHKHHLSLFTVQRAIANLARLGYLETKKGKGTFVTAPSARPSRPGADRKDTIAFVSEFSHGAMERTDFFSNLLKGLYTACGEMNKNLLCVQPQTKSLRPSSVPMSLLSGLEVSGSLLLSYNASYVMNFKKLPYPVVLIDHDMAYAGFDSIVFENKQSSYELAMALARKGARKLCYVGFAHKQDDGSYHVRDEAVWERSCGIKRCISELGLEEFEGQFSYADNLAENEVSILADRILGIKILPDALIVFDPSMAKMLGAEIKRRIGKKRKFLVGAFCNRRFYGDSGFDACAICDEYIMASKALSLLKSRIEKPSGDAKRHVVPIDIVS